MGSEMCIRDSTKLDDQLALRVAIGSVRTESRHVEDLFELLDTTA